MYIPTHFAEKDWHEIEGLMREFSFALLVSANENVPTATHLPLELEKDLEGKWKLHGHMARANPQWKNFENNKNVLAVFTGPHSYVSPSWYTQPNVPTWNYRAVHVYGNVQIVEGDVLEQRLRKMMEHYEHAHTQNPQGYDEIPSNTLKKDLRGVVGFEITIERIEAASKLSQNRDTESYKSIIEHLQDATDYDGSRIAEEMNKRKK